MSPDKKIEFICTQLLHQAKPFLVGVEQKGGAVPEIWIYLDSENDDVTITECSRFSKELSGKLDEEDLFPGGYRLNVSSPGLDRPLADIRQYKKNIGRHCEVTAKDHESMNESMNKAVTKNKDHAKKYDGVLTGVYEDRIEVTSKDKLVSILLSDIKEIKIVPVFHT